MSSKTRSVIEHVDHVIASETRTPDVQMISELIQRALSDGNGFEYVRQQRPEPLYYKKLLRCTAEQRARFTSQRGKEGEMFRTAQSDLCEVLGEFEGPGLNSGDFSAGKKDRLFARLQVLNLCLEVTPQASRKAFNTVLCKHLGAAPLHLRNPVDAAYVFTLASRDAGAENFRSLEQQRAFIDRQLALIDDLYKVRTSKERKIPSFEEAAGLEPAAFAEWFYGALSGKPVLRLRMHEPKKKDDEEEIDENEEAAPETKLHHAAVKLIQCAPEKRAALMSTKSSARADLESAARLLSEIAGEDYSGRGKTTSLHFRSQQSMESQKELRATAMHQRRDDLDLVLSMQPALDEKRADRVLTEVLGAPALDENRAVDAVYKYLLRVRAERMPELDRQRAFAHELFLRAETELNWGVALLPSTQEISGTLADVESGDVEGFEEWLRENISIMDRLDHHYWARVHFVDNLKKIARKNDAARLTSMFSVTLSNLDRKASAAQRTEWHLKNYLTMDMQALKESMFRSIESKNTLVSDSEYLMGMLRYITGADEKDGGAQNDDLLARSLSTYRGKSEPPMPEPEGTTQAQSYLSAMEIMTGCIGLDFYNIWHAIGVEYLLSRKGELPAAFPERDRWRDYYARMTADGSSLEDALWVRMDDEPDYLAALREYVGSGALPENFAAQIRAVTKAADNYEALMGHSVMLYIMSDWHYACVHGDDTSKSRADSKARRIERITSKTNSVYTEDRSDVPDVPRGLLILSELARINTAPARNYNADRLAHHMDRMLHDCGYVMLDVRRRLDFMFYCAIRIAEVHTGSKEFSFDHILTGLHEYIRAHVFSGLANELLRLYDLDSREPVRDEPVR